MAANVMEQILAELRNEAPALYPERGELRNVRLVGHTPKSQHYIYDIVIDFADGSERVAAKVYRPGREGGESARSRAKKEFESLNEVYKAFQKRKQNGVPRPLGNFTELGAVVGEKMSGVPLQ